MATLLITGGAGFIGSNLVQHALDHSSDRIVIVDKLTYAGSLLSLAEPLKNPRVSFARADIADRVAMIRLFREVRPTAVVNLAAETHVDRSIDSPYPFIDTNIVGTFVLLETAREFVGSLESEEREVFRVLHVSSDEVYGTLGSGGLFTEETPYAPNSPYAASKASADHLARAYFHTFGLPVLVTNCSNNYGPFQYPEKLIPLMILHALEGRRLPVYGDGGNVRDWLHVDDHCAALLLVLRKGRPGEKYNIGGSNERTNLQVVDALCEALEAVRPASANGRLRSVGASRYGDLKMFVPDRPGHDRRYAIDAGKVRRELGWAPTRRFEDGLRETVRWYVEHREWCDAVQADGYHGERIGLMGKDQ
jgi:dTDP-glucose 4,6-dehydratase